MSTCQGCPEGSKCKTTGAGRGLARARPTWLGEGFQLGVSAAGRGLNGRLLKSLLSPPIAFYCLSTRSRRQNLGRELVSRDRCAHLSLSSFSPLCSSLCSSLLVSQGLLLRPSSQGSTPPSPLLPAEPESTSRRESQPKMTQIGKQDSNLAHAKKIARDFRT